MLTETLTLLKITPDTPQENVPLFLSIAQEHFPEGILGLLAGKLTEMFGRPSLVARIRGESCTASLRSPQIFHITEGLERCQDLLMYYGGHAQAAGCTFNLRDFDELSKRLAADIEVQTTTDELQPSITIDAFIEPAHIDLKLCEELKLLEPFGSGNPEPMFLLKNVAIDHPRQVGSDSTHLQGTTSGIKMIGFRLGHLLSKLDKPLDIVCRVGIDTWNGRAQPQLFVEDIGVASPDRQLAVHPSDRGIRAGN